MDELQTTTALEAIINKTENDELHWDCTGNSKTLVFTCIENTHTVRVHISDNGGDWHATGTIDVNGKCVELTCNMEDADKTIDSHPQKLFAKLVTMLLDNIVDYEYPLVDTSLLVMLNSNL